MARIRKGDTVRVISGKDAQKRNPEGRVIEVLPKAGKVLVEGMNMKVRHERIRAGRRGAQEGGIQHVEAPIDMSNVMPVCPSCGRATRVGAKTVEGKKVRACKRCEAEF